MAERPRLTWTSAPEAGLCGGVLHGLLELSALIVAEREVTAAGVAAVAMRTVMLGLALGAVCIFYVLTARLLSGGKQRRSSWLLLLAALVFGATCSSAVLAISTALRPVGGLGG